MDESRGLQSVSRSFLSQIVTGEPSELFIDEGRESMQSVRITPAPFGQERGYATFLAHGARLLVGSIRSPKYIPSGVAHLDGFARMCSTRRSDNTGSPSMRSGEIT